MITFNHIFGALIVAAALAMGVHEIWLYNHPHLQGFEVTSKRLRRRLTGVALILAIVGFLTWAGSITDNGTRLALYGLGAACVIVLLALVMADLRDTTRMIAELELGGDAQEIEEMMQSPEVRELLQQLDQGDAPRQIDKDQDSANG